MSKIKCYSVRLQSMISISEKCFKATAFDGSTALIPKSQVFGQDYDVQKSEAWWVSAWILEQKDIQYSTKKVSFFDKDRAEFVSETGVEIERHIPEEKECVETEPIAELVKEDKIVKGYYLRWEEVRIAINRFGKLATRNRQHIGTYEGVESNSPKGFVELSDEQFAVAKLREGKMIEPYTVPDFAAEIQRNKAFELQKIESEKQDAIVARKREEKEVARKKELEAKMIEFESTGENNVLVNWMKSGFIHPAPSDVMKEKEMSGLNWKKFQLAIEGMVLNGCNKTMPV